MSKLIHAIFWVSSLGLLAGCLPDDTILNLAYSPDGQLIALVSEKQGLRVADPAALEIRSVFKGRVDPANVSWTTDSLRMLFSSPGEGTQDLYVATLDGTTTRITSLPSVEFWPSVLDDSVLYLSTESGNSQLTSQSLSHNRDAQLLSHPMQSVFAPSLSPDGSQLAWMVVDKLCPQIERLDLRTGVITRETSETDPLALPVSPVAWNRNGSGFAYLRLPVEGQHEQESLFHTEISSEKDQVKANSIRYHDLQSSATDPVLVESSSGVWNPAFIKSGELLFNENRTLNARRNDGAVVKVESDLRAGKAVAGGDDGEIAFVAANQLIGVTSQTLDWSRYLTFELPDKFLLAEEYYRLGSEMKSYNLYEELASSVQRTRDPEMAKFVYIANLRRLGHVQKAVSETEKLLREQSLSDRVPPELLWRLLGFSFLLEMDDIPQAKTSLEHYAELTSGSAEKEPESAENALAIIRHGDDGLTRLYARAMMARLKGDFYETDRLFGDLLTSAPQVTAIQREYLNALNGFDREVYFFSPTQRPFRPTRFQQAEYLERLVRLAPDSDFMQSVRLDLFVLRIELGSYSRARQLLRDALTSSPMAGRPEGLLEVFSNYLETPEPQPWINHSMPEVFLHPEIRPLLEEVTREPEDRFLMGVAATKMALLANDPDQARREADIALKEWNRIATDERGNTLYERYGRLQVMRAREAELRGLYGEAIEAYRRALQMMEDRNLVNCEFQEEVRYRASLLAALQSDYPDALPRLREMELRSGVELINPNWEADSLSALVRDQVRACSETSSTQQQWLTYEAGVVFAKMKLNAQARAAFKDVTSHGTADFIRRRAMLELASLDDLEGDAWNSARNYARLAALPDSGSYTKGWCSYHIARLHLSINYKVSEAREALAFIVTAWPGTPLVTQAQELLLSTETR